MNKSEFIAEVAKRSGHSKTVVSEVIEAGLATAMDAVSQGTTISIVGFGSLSVKSRAERVGRNPKTKEAVIIPASKQPVFKPGTAMKQAANS